LNCRKNKLFELTECVHSAVGHHDHGH
jgi:hypothetical protein